MALITMPRSLPARLVVFVGAAVLFGMLLSGGIALMNVAELSRDATREIESGLTRASQEYLSNYIETTAGKVDLLIDQVHSEVATLAGAMQSLIDNQAAGEAIGGAIADDAKFNAALGYDATGEWAQSGPGASVLSIWGYLLDADKRPRADVAKLARDTAIFDLVSANLMASGAAKLQVYYVGPKSMPIMRTTPWSAQAQTFDRLYPGHNKANFWDFFFPGVYEGWQAWAKQPDLVPVKGDFVTETVPYVDATTGKLVVSFFHPLWTSDRRDVAGMTAADVTLEQLAAIVESVKIAETGFAFLVRSSGNVLAITSEGEKTLGLKMANAGSEQGITALDRRLQNSGQAAIAALKLPEGDSPVINHIGLEQNGAPVSHMIALRHLGARNLWTGPGAIGATQLYLGFVVPDAEIYASLNAAQEQVTAATSRIFKGQIIALILSMLMVLAAIFAISKRITAGLAELSAAARRLKEKDYSVRIKKPGGDEVGEVGVAFNSMAEDVRYHTENLEHIVADRTQELAAANAVNLALNERLKSENQRLGTELDVARRIQMMVLPKAAELAAISRLDIATYMEPADEIGGDYYDVLQVGDRIKVGIGDVTGHGLESGVLMLMVQSVARGLQEQGDGDPVKFLNVLNRAVYKNVERTESGKHLSLAFVDYGVDEVVISGQHEEVLIVRAGGAVERIDTNDLGFPIGLEPEIEAFVATKTVSFNSGDVMILYTDGINEAESPDGELFGMDRLCDSAAAHSAGSAEFICKGIVADLMAFISTQRIHDDITLVVLKHR